MSFQLAATGRNCKQISAMPASKHSNLPQIPPGKRQQPHHTGYDYQGSVPATRASRCIAPLKVHLQEGLQQQNSYESVYASNVSFKIRVACWKYTSKHHIAPFISCDKLSVETIFHLWQFSHVLLPASFRVPHHKPTWNNNEGCGCNHTNNSSWQITCPPPCVSLVL